MNPGVIKPHPAFPTNCLRGGLRLILLVGRQDQYLMVGLKGESINEEILPRVAMSVAMKGNLIEYGALKFLMVNPADIRQTGKK